MEVRHLVRGVNSAGAYVRSTHLRDNTYSEFGGASLEAIAHDRNIDTDCVNWKLRTCNSISIISIDTFLGGVICLFILLRLYCSRNSLASEIASGTQTIQNS
jgi:hypothetical protein